MKSLLLSIIFLATGFVHAQQPALYKSFEIYLGDTINRIDRNDAKQGRWIFFGKNKKGAKFRLYKREQIVEEGHYINDKKSKLWKTYNSNGKLKSEITYENDIPKGIARFYNPDGVKISEGVLENKKWVGSYVVYDVKGNKITKDSGTSLKKGILKFSGIVQKGGKPLEGVKIAIERNDFEINEFVTKADGLFSFDIELHFDYSLFFSKQGINDQSLEINTNVGDIADTSVYTLSGWKINMYDNIASATTNELFGFLMNKPSSQISFNKRKRKFSSEGAYVHLFTKGMKDINESTRFLLAQAADDNKKLEIENLRMESENKIKEIELLKKEQMMKDAELRQKEAEITAQKLEAEKKAKDLALFEQEKKIKELMLEQKQIEIEKQKLEASRKAKELENFAILKKVQELEIANQKSALSKKNTELEEKNREAEMKSKELSFANREKEISNKELRQNRIYMYIYFAGFLVIGIFSFFLVRNIKQKKKAFATLENQAKEIVIQKTEIEEKSLLIEQKNLETEQSIVYAKRIQHAILPPMSQIESYMTDFFILYKPKDIVSGDFYFFSDKHAKDGRIVIAAVDCTGHGVPGAFMSLIGSEKLSDAVEISSQPSEILYELNRGVKQSLRQSGEDDNSTRDGMDISLCVLPAHVNGATSITAEYAGANRPIWIIKKSTKELIETRATKTAIGGFTSDEQKFEQHNITLEKGDTFYLFTDGFADQFGGENRKKLMTKKFKEILIGIQDMKLADQRTYLDNFIEEWKGETEQVDDILVIGYRV